MHLYHCFQRHGDATEARHRVRRARAGFAAYRPGLHPRLQVRFVTRVSKIGKARVVNYRPQRSCGKVRSLYLSVILSTGGGLPPPGQTPQWADTTLGRQPPEQTPPWADTPLPSACWDTHPPCPVHAGIQSTSGRYASYWNAFLF